MKRELKETKIVCTLGPTSAKDQVVSDMLSNGMDIVRLNFSHGNRDDKLIVINQLKKIRKMNPGLHFGVAMDTQGPEIRTKLFEPVKVKKGDFVTFCNKKRCYIKNHIHFNYKRTARLKKGFCFSVDDGKLELVVESTTTKRIIAIAGSDYWIDHKKSVTIPGKSLGLPYIDLKDKDDIVFGCEHCINFIFASFVSNKDDIIQIKNIVNRKLYKPLIIAKIESIQGIRNLKEIIEEADGIMIARGDLCAEIGYKKLFATQKLITVMTKEANKPLIVATQMIENMINETVPTRPEITDIGNAVLDGNDCIMTSGETAIGKHPSLVVEVMKNICKDAESYKNNNKQIVTNFDIKKIEIFSKCEIDETKECNIDAIFLITKRYRRVLEVYQQKLNVPIFVVTRSRFELQKCAILQNVFPILKSKEILNNKKLDITYVYTRIQKQIERLYDYKKMKNVFVCSDAQKIQKVVELKYDDINQDKNKN